MFTTRPQLLGTMGMATSTHWLASAAGMAVLEEGGNAFDAAVAMGLTLHVVEPHLNGFGGDAPIIGHDARTASTWVICGQGTAPAAATIGAFGELDLDLVPGTGHLPAVVPGAFGAWLELLARHGAMPLDRLFRFAIGYARDGYPLVQQAVDTITAVADLFTEHWPTSAEIYLPGGTPPVARSRFANPQLAATLQKIVDHAMAAGSTREAQIEAARRYFYDGPIAEAIADYVAGTAVMDSTGTPHSGLLSYDDLASWRATVEAPATVDFQGYTVAKTGAWGQGPVMLQQLAMLDTMDLAATAAGSAELVHTVVEVAKLAFADREAYYGDPDFSAVPLDALLSPEYSRSRAALVTGVASADLRPGTLDGASTRLPGMVSTDRSRAPRAAGTGEPTVQRSGVTRGDTCHLDVVDRWGNMVSATPSGGWLQSSPAIPGLGFGLPTRGQMFWLEPGLPNSLEPRKRPRTTLSPGLVLRDGAPYLAFGTPGGDQQDQWPVPFLINHLVFGLDLQVSIDAPNWHSTHMPSSFYPRDSEPLGLHVESRIGAGVIADLERRGHVVTESGPWTLGRISAAGIRADGMLVAAANARGMQGYAAGR